MLSNISRSILDLHTSMLASSNKGDIVYGNNDQPLTLLSITKLFLKYHYLAELSDPRCLFEPPPGEKLSYSQDTCREIMSFTGKPQTRIQQGEQVEVLFPGLYFLQSETGGTKMQAVPPLVRRYVPEEIAASKSGSSWW